MQKISAAVVGFILSIGNCPARQTCLSCVRHIRRRPVLNWTGLISAPMSAAASVAAASAIPPVPEFTAATCERRPALAGVQVGFNWQVPNANWVLGVEADHQRHECHRHQHLSRLRPACFSRRIAVCVRTRWQPDGTCGFRDRTAGRTLLYAKGGAAWLSEQIDITSNMPVDTGLSTPAASLDGSRWGWTVGAGVEQALAPAWSVKMEYDDANFGSVDAPTPVSLVERVPGSAVRLEHPPGATSASQTSTPSRSA